MDRANKVQILGKAFCILLCLNAFGKGMNPLLRPQLRVKSKANWTFSEFKASTMAEWQNQELKSQELSQVGSTSLWQQKCQVVSHFTLPWSPLTL